MALKRPTPAPRGVAHPRAPRSARPLHRALAGLNPDSTQALLGAAACAPGSIHRQPSVLMLWSHSIAHPSSGATAACASDLASLLLAARAAQPALEMREDWLPGDPRRAASYYFDGRRHRIHPGLTEHALDVLDELVAWADVSDGLLADVHGFGISDLLGLAVRYSDNVIEQLAASWPGTVRPDFAWQSDAQSALEQTRQIAALPAVLNEAEVMRYAKVDLDAAFTDAISYGGQRGVSAARWATGDAVHSAVVMRERPSHDLPFFALSDARRRRHPIPVGAVLSALQAACAVLLRDAHNPQAVRARLSAAAMRTVTTALTPWREPPADGPAQPADTATDDTLAEPACPSDCEPGTAADAVSASVAMFHLTEHLVAAIAVVCALDESEAAPLIAAATEQLASVHGDTLAQAGMPVRADASIVPLIVMAGPTQVRSVIEQGTPMVLSALDLLLMFRTARSGAGLDEAWRFLRAATTAGHLALLSPSVLDAWQFWCAVGGLTFADVGDVESALTRTGWITCDDSWTEYTAWDAVDTTLHALGLPPARCFPLAELEDHMPGAATLWPPFPGVAYCVAVPSLLVYADLTPDFASANPAPSLALSLASGIRDRLADIGVPTALTGPVAVVLDLDRVPDDGATEGDEAAVPTVVIRLGPDWFALVEQDPHEAARACGQQILGGLEPMLTEDAAAFLEAWAARGPLLVTGSHATPLAPRRALNQAFPHSAERAAWRAIADTTLPVGVHQGGPAKALARAHLYPAAQERLRQLSARYDHSATLTRALATVDACLGQLAQQRDDTRFGLAGPWAQTVRKDALAAGLDLLKVSRNAQVLVEYLNADPANDTPGLAEPDRFDLADLLAAAGVAVETGAAADHPGPTLADLGVMVTERGAVIVLSDLPRLAAPDVDLPGGRSIDMHRFAACVQAHQHRVDERDEPEIGDGLTPGEHPFVPVDWTKVPGRYAAVEEAMIGELGAGMTAVSAVLADLTSRMPDTDGILWIDRRAVTVDITAWAGVVPHEEIDAAFTLLTLPPDSKLNWWRMEKRTHRLLTHPLLEHNGTLISAPHLLHTTQVLWSGYLAQGRLMWPGVSARLRHAVDLLAKRGGEDFEELVAQRLDQLNWPHRPIPFEELTRHGVAVRGEIDALVADTARRRIWVLEAKTGAIPHAADSMQTEIQRFHKRNGHIDHVLENTVAVQAAPGAAASLLGLAGRDWDVIPLIVTRHVSPAAFVPDPRVPFTVLDDLLDVLRNPEPPQAGHTPIGTRRR